MAFLFSYVQAIEDIEAQETAESLRLSRRILRDINDPFTLDEWHFIRNFRLSKDAAAYLLRQIDSFLHMPARSTWIPNAMKVCATLAFLGSGSYQRPVGRSVSNLLSQPSVSRAIRDVTNAIYRRLLRKWVRFANTDEEKDYYKESFENSCGMRQIIGVVDGTHVAIVKPTQNEQAFVNRKGYHSLNVQIVCNSDLDILNVVAKWPGSTHDAFVWRNSTVNSVMKATYEHDGCGSFILGDSGYPCLPWLLTPLTTCDTAQETAYNLVFKKTRSRVERCIGVLKGRFRCLLKDRTLHYTPKNAARIIITCSILHNICNQFRVAPVEPMWDEADYQPQLAAPSLGDDDGHLRRLGQQARRDYIFNNF